MPVDQELFLKDLRTGLYPDTTILGPEFSTKIGGDERVAKLHMSLLGTDKTVLEGEDPGFPIPTVVPTLSDIEIPKYKFRTKNHRIIDPDQLNYAAELRQPVVNEMQETLREHSGFRAAYNFTPAAAGATSYIENSTGSDYLGFKRLTLDDLQQMEFLFNEALVPLAGRVMALTPRGKRDLEHTNNDLRNQFMGWDGVAPLMIASFKIVVCPTYPLYNSGNTKKAFKSAYVSGDKYPLALFWNKRDVLLDNISNKLYESEENADYEASKLHVTQQVICFQHPDAINGAILTGTAY